MSKDKKQESKAVAPVANTAVSTEVATMFAADAGAGFEDGGAEDYAIPFLSVLQKGSPQVDDASGQALPNAKQGMFFENVSGRMFDGKDGVKLIPCGYRRTFIRWAPKGSDGGFRGEISPEAVAAMREAGQVKELDGKLYIPLEDGTVHEKKCDRLADTRNHYVLIVEEDGSTTQALLSLTSTKIKKSKMLMTLLSQRKTKTPAGMVQLPMFANVVKATSIPEQNDKGSWMGVRFEVVGNVESQSQYESAKQFHALVKAGKVAAKYEEPVGAGEGSDNEKF